MKGQIIPLSLRDIPLFKGDLICSRFLKKSLDSTAKIRYNERQHRTECAKTSPKRRIYMEVYRIHMGKAKCAVDLGDGSERGEYVSQDYILAKMGRPHRSISLMYCYYPLDKGWPGFQV